MSKNNSIQNLSNQIIDKMGVNITNLYLNYTNTYLYEQFCATFCPNKVHVILGKSGCGKTSLLNAIANFVPYQGTIEAGKISYVFQSPRLAPTSVFNNVDMALCSVYPNKVERKNVVSHYLDLAQISNLSANPIANLSGGEQQRVCLARAFAYPSQTLLMDEPFKSLDLGIRKKLYATLVDMLRENPRTTLLVTHDVDEALALADTIYLLHDTPCHLTKIADITTSQLERNLYQQSMLDLRKQLESLL